MENSDNIVIKHIDTELDHKLFSVSKPIETALECRNTKYEPILSDKTIDILNRIRTTTNTPISIQSGPRKKFKWYQINWFRKIVKYIRVSINKIKHPILRCSPEEMDAIIKKLKEREI